MNAPKDVDPRHIGRYQILQIELQLEPVGSFAGAKQFRHLWERQTAGKPYHPSIRFLGNAHPAVHVHR